MRVIYLQDLTRASQDELEQILVSINRTAKLTPPAAKWLARLLKRHGDGVVARDGQFDLAVATSA